MFHKTIGLDDAFRKMEKVLVRRERARLIRAGIIVPAIYAKPQVLVKQDDGSWRILI